MRSQIGAAGLEASMVITLIVKCQCAPPPRERVRIRTVILPGSGKRVYVTR